MCVQPPQCAFLLSERADHLERKDKKQRRVQVGFFTFVFLSVMKNCRQKFSDDTAITGSVEMGWKEEYRGSIDCFMRWLEEPEQTHLEGRVCCWYKACHSRGGDQLQNAGKTAGNHGQRKKKNFHRTPM